MAHAGKAPLEGAGKLVLQLGIVLKNVNQNKEQGGLFHSPHRLVQLSQQEQKLCFVHIGDFAG